MHTRLLHFVFSCRALGMGVEQYLYNSLNRPALEIAGEVVSNLSGIEIPGWINRVRTGAVEEQLRIQDLTSNAVLLKGPCDLVQIFPFIANSDLFDTEFSYTIPNGTFINSVGHTTHITQSLRLSPERRKQVAEEFPFLDAGVFSDKLFTRDYRVVFLSILSDCNLGVYRRKETGEQVAFGEYLNPLTDRKNWPKLISGEYYTANFRFTEEILREFTEKYEFLGRNSPETILRNLRYIRRNLPENCVLVVMLGSELRYEKSTYPAYSDRHAVHKEVNDLIRKWAETEPYVRLVDVNPYMTNQSCFNNHPNHYSKPVYYDLSQEIVRITNETLGNQRVRVSQCKKLRIYTKQLCKICYRRLTGLLKGSVR